MSVLHSCRESGSSVHFLAPGVGAGSPTGISTWIIPYTRRAVGGCATFPPGFESAAVTTMAETVKVRKESRRLKKEGNKLLLADRRRNPQKKHLSFV